MRDFIDLACVTSTVWFASFGIIGGGVH